MQEKQMFTLSDLIHLVKRSKKTILFWTFACALFTSLWVLTKPIEYRALGSFREKAVTQSGMGKNFNASLIFSAIKSEDSEATTTMRSKQILRRAVQNLNLQGTLKVPRTFGKWGLYLERIRNHLKADWSTFWHPLAISLSDPALPLKAVKIRYAGETSRSLKVYFTSEESYELYDPRTGVTSKRRVGETVNEKGYTFTLVRNDDRPVTKRRFSLLLTPEWLAIRSLANKSLIKADRNDKTLISVECLNRDRHIAATTVNAVMHAYHDYLTEEQYRIANDQLDYLNFRQENMNQTLSKMLQEHATKISQDLSTSGFPDASHALNYLSSQQSQYQHKIFDLDLETKRLAQAKEEGYTHYNFLDASMSNRILNEIRELNQQADVIKLALEQASNKDRGFLLQLTSQQVDELHEVKGNIEEANNLIAMLDRDELPSKTSPLVKNPKYLAKTWNDRLIETPQRSEVKTQYSAYLKNLLHLFQVNEKILNERLAYHENPTIEFQGINLPLAKELYLNYSKKHHEIEAKTLEHEFIIDQIQSPDFEVTSLGALLNDPISKELIAKASQLTFALKEPHNRSAKEQQRLQEEITTKKLFLAEHLKQAAHLLTLQQNLIKEKIHSLQQTTLGLIQQQISILEENLQDYLNQRLADLGQERKVIERHQKELNASMVSLPEKWAEEKLIDQKMNTNKLMAAEITKLIESKNLASNLEVIRSAPLDLAVPTINPLKSKVVFFAVVGMFIGFFSSVGFLVTRACVTGIRVSEENLKLAGLNVLGHLTTAASKQPPLDRDLETLRHVSAISGGTLLTVGELDYSTNLANLLRAGGQKVLVMHLSSDGSSEGLLDYLEGELEEPPIIDDVIRMGGFNRYSSELLSSLRFQEMLKQSNEEYDTVIAVLKEKATSASASNLMMLFDKTVMTLQNETLDQLKHKENCSFVITS